MSHPLGPIWEILVAIETVATRHQVAGQVYVFVYRDLALDANLVFDFIKPDKSFYRMPAKVNERFMIPGTDTSQLVAMVVNKFETQLKNGAAPDSIQIPI